MPRSICNSSFPFPRTESRRVRSCDRPRDDMHAIALLAVSIEEKSSSLQMLQIQMPQRQIWPSSKARLGTRAPETGYTARKVLSQ